MQELPRKAFYRVSEVCEYTDTQPYVLRFWESEFPQLKPESGASGQRVYRRKDIDLVCRIKELLYDEEYSLEDARTQLAKELARGKQLRPAQPRLHAAPTEPRRPGGMPPTLEQRTKQPTAPIEPAALDSVPRQRYQTAVDEIDHLRLALKEAEKNQRRADAAAAEAREQAELEQRRYETAVRHLERLQEILSDA